MKLPFLEFSQHPDISERVRYHISQLVDYFHAVPHFDVNLQPVDGTFDPYNNIYLEVSFPFVQTFLSRYSVNSLRRVMNSNVKKLVTNRCVMVSCI